MQQSETRQAAKTAHRQTKASTTLNRKYVRRPETITMKEVNTLRPSIQIRPKAQTSPMISHFNTTIVNTMPKKVTQAEPVKLHPTQAIANQKLRERREQTTRTQAQKLTAKQLKDQAIQKALATASQATNEGTMAKTITKQQKKVKNKIHFGFGRVVLALTCAAAAVFAIVYFVSVNMPDVQFRATATQLDANYPNYLPRNYSPTDISSENKIVTLSFINRTSNESFKLIEEKSSWDSNSLLNNYVKEEFGDSYAIIREQGLTIYIGNNKAAWVNGGVVYKLNVIKGSLTKKQISSIAASL